MFLFPELSAPSVAYSPQLYVPVHKYLQTWASHANTEELCEEATKFHVLEAALGRLHSVIGRSVQSRPLP